MRRYFLSSIEYILEDMAWEMDSLGLNLEKRKWLFAFSHNLLWNVSETKILSIRNTPLFFIPMLVFVLVDNNGGIWIIDILRITYFKYPKTFLINAFRYFVAFYNCNAKKNLYFAATYYVIKLLEISTNSYF